MKLTGGSSRGLQEISLEAIVGSVGRYSDFTRSFLPLHNSDERRWAEVGAAVTSLEGVPPIEVYQVGEIYFVLDGNHRVSVARQMGNIYIEAYVTEFKTNIPLTATDNLDDLIIKAEYADFRERTRLDQIKPEADLRVTVPGRYRELETHIEAHAYLKYQESGLPSEAAVADWYDHVYLPLIEIIREKGILRDFPNRTETDLYLWIHKHRARLTKELGWPIDPLAALSNLVTEHSPSPSRVVARLEEKLVDTFTFDELEDGPTPGTWRTEWLTHRPEDRLFGNILVPLSGTPDCWQAFNQAVDIANRHGGQLYGLHVVPTPDQLQSEPALAVQAEFNQRCQLAQIPGQMSIVAGKIARTICDRARWSDLVVLHLAHPPTAQLLGKLSSGLRTIIQRSPRPILFVPNQAYPLERALLAYDDSPKAQEGLFIAAYLAGQWQTQLLVVTIAERETDHAKLNKARSYLRVRGIPATFIPASGAVAETILHVADRERADLIIMGGYGSTPIVEAVLGSAVDQVLRQSQRPMLICR